MSRLTPQDLLELTPDLIAELTRDSLEKTTLLVVELALDLANRLGRDSSTSSQPPSKDNPYRRGRRREQAEESAAGDTGDGSAADAGQPAGGVVPSGKTANTGATDKAQPKSPAKSGKRPGMPGLKS